MSAFDPSLFSLICLELGIVPNVSLDKDGDELKNMLDQLTPEEARKCKRKFRKIHRRLKNKKIKNAESFKHEKLVNKCFGEKGASPTQSQRRRRREIVRSHLKQKSMTKWNDE